MSGLEGMPMHTLELKVPPLVVVMIIAAGMWLASK